MHSTPIRLDYHTPGEPAPRYVLVFPPPLEKYRLVECHYLELRHKIGELGFADLSDGATHALFAAEYREIGLLLFPGVPVDWLVPSSRFKFFVTAGAVLVEDGQVRLAASNLERLLGYEVSQPTTEGESAKPKPIVISTGRSDLDIEVDLLLAPFADHTWEIIKRHSLPEVLMMMRQASDRLAGEEAVRKIQQQRDREAWDADKNSILMDAASLSRSLKFLPAFHHEPSPDSPNGNN